MRRLVVCLCSVFLLVGLAGSVHASPAIGFSNDPNTWSVGSNNWGLGFTFTPTTDITVTELGVYDYGQDGFMYHDHDGDGQEGTPYVNTRNVAMYSSAGDRLAFATVASEDPLGGFFRYRGIEEPLKLAAEATYFVAAINGWEAFAYDPEDFLVSSEIMFLSAGHVDPPAWGPILTENISVLLDDTVEYGNFGGNFQYEVTNIPLPSTVILLASAIFGVAAVRKRHTE